MSGRGFDEFVGGGGGGLGDGPLGFGDAEIRRRKLRDIQDVAGELRRPVAAPDLTAAILARVEEERPFVSERTRRLVWVSRLAFAASLGIGAVGIALLHRSAPELVQFRSQPQPFSDVVQVAKTEASAGYQSIRTTLSSVGDLASAGDRTLVGRVVERGSASEDAGGGGGVGLAVMDARLAPLPPSYGATYVSLSMPRGSGLGVGSGAAVEAGIAGSEPVVVSTVRLAPGLAPRPLVADAMPSAVYWGGVSGRLSTAPAASTAVPVILTPNAFGAPRPLVAGRGVAAGAVGGAGLGMDGLGAGGLGVERRVLDTLAPASAAIGSGETAVPR